MILLLASLLLAAPARAADVKTLTLGQAYAAALKRSEAVAERGQTYEQVLAQIQELWSEIKPRLSLTGTQVWQDTPGPGVGFPIPASQQTVAISGHQPIFAGLRDFLAVRGAHAQSESAELALRRAKQLLYQDVAGAYLNLLQSRRAIATREAQVRLTADRVKELENFEAIGRSRKSEVLAAQAQMAQAQADLETSRGQDRLYEETFKFLTGLDDELQPQEISAPAQAGDESPFLERAARRADVEAARKDLEYAGFYVSIQRRQYWPTVALDGNYYLRRPSNFYKRVNWDATLSGILPIYSGGQISAQVREAQAMERYREQALSLAERQAALDVRSAYADLTSQLTVLEALRKAMALAEENAKAQAADYRHGLVTNIDVLASLTTEQDTRLRLDQAELQAYDAGVRLEVAAGGPENIR